MQDIFEHVDEQLDAERVHKFWQQNRKWVIGGLILLFVSLFVYVQWRDYRVQQSQAASDQFVMAQDLFDKEDRENGQKQLQKLLKEYSGHGYALFGRFLQAKSLVAEGKTAAAVEQLQQLVKEADTPLLVDLALLNAAYLTSGDGKRSVAFLTRIKDDSPYRAHALELQGLLAAQSGDDKNALASYQEARALAPEGTLRRRLESRLERLAGEEKK